MRSAAYLAASLVAIGLYVAAAAAFGFSPAVLGIGILVISTVAAVSLVATGSQPEPAHRPS